MRVMQVVTQREGWGGADHQACTLAEGLAETMDSWVLAPSGHRIFSRLSAKVRAVPMTLGSGFRPHLALPFVRLVQREKIAVIDFHSSHGHNFALLVRRLLPRVKFVVHRHNIYSPSRGVFTRYKYLHGGIDRFICVSQAVRNVLLRYGVTPSQAVAVLATVPPPRYRGGAKQRQRQTIYARYRLNPDLPLIGTVANLLEHRKGYDTLLQALKLLKEDGVPLQAIFCGQGPDRAKLEKQCQALHLHEDVRFAGFVAEVYDLLTAVDIFCFPSRDEALGLAVQEAAHAGCCIVATRSGGVPEMVEHGTSSMLSDEGDAVALASNLQLVLNDVPLRQRLAANAKTHVAQNLSVEKMVTDTAQVYAQLFNTHTAKTQT